MIVYNVARRWFSDKAMADKYRVSQGLKPSALQVVRVESRDDLSALLNALCDPPAKGQPVPAPATPALVDQAYVPPSRDIPDCVPQFLRKDWSVS